MIFFNCVSKSYKEGKKAVDNLSLTIEDGTIFGFLGPNGAGKSTTIKMIVGLLSQDSGTISIDSTSDALQIKRNLGYVPDEPLFYERMTGMEHIDFICNVFQVSDRKQRTEELCTLFDFHALSDEIRSYSHGMKQKLAVISALIHQPKLLVLDEPMVGLDPRSSYVLKQTMRDYAAKGNTVFFSTHVLEVAQELCTQVGIIDKGKLLYQGTFKDLQKGSDQSLEELFLKLTEKTGE